jgi:Lrp/AsnC family leucine-responsive transcriptional regulator
LTFRCLHGQLLRMPSNQKSNGIDAIDSKILRVLTENGRMSWAELGAALKLSAPAAADRVRRLEERQLIRGYTALLDPEQVGAEVTAFIAVRLERPRHRPPFIKRVLGLEGVLECHHLAGEDDYLLKVRVANLRTLEKLVGESLKGVEGVASTRTTIALSTVKETPTPPLSALEGNS